MCTHLNIPIIHVYSHEYANNNVYSHEYTNNICVLT